MKRIRAAAGCSATTTAARMNAANSEVQEGCGCSSGWLGPSALIANFRSASMSNASNSWRSVWVCPRNSCKVTDSVPRQVLPAIYLGLSWLSGRSWDFPGRMPRCLASRALAGLQKDAMPPRRRRPRRIRSRSAGPGGGGSRPGRARRRPSTRRCGSRPAAPPDPAPRPQGPACERLCTTCVKTLPSRFSGPITGICRAAPRPRRPRPRPARPRAGAASREADGGVSVHAGDPRRPRGRHVRRPKARPRAGIRLRNARARQMPASQRPSASRPDLRPLSQERPHKIRLAGTHYLSDISVVTEMSVT